MAMLVDNEKLSGDMDEAAVEQAILIFREITAGSAKTEGLTCSPSIC